MRANSAYELRLIGVLTVMFGFVFFDRNAMGNLAPFLQPALHLSNGEIGALSSGLSICWAISSFVIGSLSDAMGRRKGFLLVTVVIFSVCSLLSGLATSFAMLLVTRMIMGFAEGPILPISQSLVVLESAENRRGFNMGVMQNLGSNLIGSFFGPVILTLLAERFSWRGAFYVAAVPGLICAVLIWKYVREPQELAGVLPEAPGTPGRPGGAAALAPSTIGAAPDSAAAALAASAAPRANAAALGTGTAPRANAAVLAPGAAAATAPPARMAIGRMFGYRNMWVCVLLSCFMVPWMILGWTFLPSIYVNLRHFSPDQSSWLVGVLGISAAVFAFIVPGLSDRVGRKPVMIVFTLIGVMYPLAALYYSGSPLMLAFLVFIGWSASGTFPLFMATIPSETIPSRYVATTLGLVMGMGELIGGGAVPWLAGRAADYYHDLAVPMWIASALALVGTVLTLFLVETAPVKVAAAARLAVRGAAVGPTTGT